MATEWLKQDLAQDCVIFGKAFCFNKKKTRSSVQFAKVIVEPKSPEGSVCVCVYLSVSSKRRVKLYLKPIHYKIKDKCEDKGLKKWPSG